MPLQPRWLDYLHDVPVMEQIMKRLGEMSQLLLALNDNVIANNRRFDRLDERLSEMSQKLDRIENKIATLELRVGELGVRLAALEAV